MPKQQVPRFAVGTADGPRSRTWRLWVPRGKSDVYVSSRRIANSVKVSLHEPGPSRFALTSEFVREQAFVAPEGRDRRLAVEWNPTQDLARPRRPAVRDRRALGRGHRPRGPRDRRRALGAAAARRVRGALRCRLRAGQDAGVGSSGRAKHGTELVGEVALANGERVFVTCLVREMNAETRASVERLRSVRVLDANGNPIKTGVLGFGTEPNPDADDGTEVATVTDVTRLDERA